jgi:dTDP-4-amino-4,6-dideoxygalactose transaminase
MAEQVEEKIYTTGEKSEGGITSRFFYKQQFNLPMHPRLTLQELEDTVYGIRETAKKLAKR